MRGAGCTALVTIGKVASMPSIALRVFPRLMPAIFGPQLTVAPISLKENEL